MSPFRINIITIFILALQVYGCKSNTVNKNKITYNKQSIALYNKALLTAKDSSDVFNFRDTTYILKAIDILDSAIILDSNYYLAYSLKSEFFLAMKKREPAIKAMQFVCNRKENYAEGYAFTGFVYDAMSRTDSAKYYYQKSIDAYLNRISQKKFDEEDELVNIAFMQFLIDGNKQRAIKIIKAIDAKEKHKKYFVLHEAIEEFNREEFLKNY